ncbi:MAG: hypothetical protein ACFE9S_12390 [Candidatus Hermodarchaeota archaeon]
MKFPNMSNLGKIKNQKKQSIKFLTCLTLTFIILLNFTIFTNFNKEIITSEEDFSTNYFNNNSTKNDLQTSTPISILQDPFTRNFDELRNFFDNKYQSTLPFTIPVYYRNGDTEGDIIDGTIYSGDNLLYYKSLKQDELSDIETFETYLDLKETTLWYEGVGGDFDYGFVNSIDNLTGAIINDNRFLYDNLMPIFLLIENIGDEINSFSVSGKFPRNSINEMFYLINSSEFWDDRYAYYGFYNYNSSDTKYSESNFYAILANLLIHRTYLNLGLDQSIRNRAYELANLTIVKMVDDGYMWDSSSKAFYHDANQNWDTSIAGQKYYHLSTNALGIITLLEFWIESGMKNDSIYFQNAVDLYNSLDYLYDNGLYKKIATPGWSTIFDHSKDLNDNALMMSACLKLFEVTGNITYYKRAFQIYNSIENNLYDTTNKAYNFSLTDTSKSFQSNLRLSEACLDALLIYNSTSLDTNYNVSGEVPNFIFNQDSMNLTSVYSFIKRGQFFNPDNGSYGRYIVQYDITNFTINYIFKYPNGTFFYEFEDFIGDPDTSYTLLYNITDSHPINDEYRIYLWANTTYFKLTDALKKFNVTSGLFSESIKGLPRILYHGPIVNVSININYTRIEDSILTASLEGQDIINDPSQLINFTNSQLIQIDFNLTAKFGAEPGNSEISFKIKQGNVIYLEIIKIIEIGYSFDYSNFLYQNTVVMGENIFLSMTLKNFLPNASQSLNVSFKGVTEPSIEDFIQEEILIENEIRVVSYYLKTFDTISNNTIKIRMEILINTTVYYTRIFNVEIVPKFEIISATFPDTIPQGDSAYLIIIIQSNQEEAEAFSLYINNVQQRTNINQLIKGENIVTVSLIPTINPYELGVKKYRVELKDSENTNIALLYFEVSLELSNLNLILFYILPLLAPIGIVLYFKNKHIKYKKLRR